MVMIKGSDSIQRGLILVYIIIWSIDIIIYKWEINQNVTKHGSVNFFTQNQYSIKCHWLDS